MSDKTEKPDIIKQKVRNIGGLRGEPWYKAEVEILGGRKGKGFETTEKGAIGKAYEAAKKNVLPKK